MPHYITPTWIPSTAPGAQFPLSAHQEHLGLHKVGLSVGQLLLEHRAVPGMGVLCGVVLLLLLLIASMDAISLVSSTHRNPSYRLQ